MTLVVVGALFAGCGSEERNFTAGEFVDVINAEGAGVELGEVITTSPEGVEVHSIRFSEAVSGVSGPAVADEHASNGTLLMLPDADAAREEFDRCEGAISLTCFRAANAVLRFEEMDGAEQARVVTSLEAIQTGED